MFEPSSTHAYYYLFILDMLHDIYPYKNLKKYAVCIQNCWLSNPKILKVAFNMAMHDILGPSLRASTGVNCLEAS